VITDTLTLWQYLLAGAMSNLYRSTAAVYEDI